MHAKEIDAYLEHFLRNGDPDSFHSLIELGNEVLPHLGAVLTAGRGQDCVSCLDLLRDIRTGEALSVILGLMKHDSPQVWQHAAESLAYHFGNNAPERLRILARNIGDDEKRAYVEKMIYDLQPAEPKANK